MSVPMFLQEVPSDMIDCGFCHTLDYRTFIAHCMMCNYQDGIASQSVVEVIEDTFAMLKPEGIEARIVLLSYPRGVSKPIPQIAHEHCIPLHVFYCWRMQWLRRLAAALIDAELIDLQRPLIANLDCDALMIDSAAREGRGAVNRDIVTDTEPETITAYQDFPPLIP